ncbi:hypothetical protein GDO86_016717 [Hymenochirus boettgeri]|uniref:Uncharacterized protein n=1 Tax=Hymenochirus boettgeri TaxID=247094 RepID=A0A8T2IJK1_9PIPI|nr:hypothetical protein GDO86_016717 [Hymenochirus boettgeri]
MGGPMGEERVSGAPMNPCAQWVVGPHCVQVAQSVRPPRAGHSLSSAPFSCTVVVEWLYSPWAIRCRASPFLSPEAFLILALLFWNQILIWDSLRFSSWANVCRLCSVM